MREKRQSQGGVSSTLERHGADSREVGHWSRVNSGPQTNYKNRLIIAKVPSAETFTFWTVCVSVCINLLVFSQVSPTFLPSVGKTNKDAKSAEVNGACAAAWRSQTHLSQQTGSSLVDRIAPLWATSCGGKVKIYFRTEEWKTPSKAKQGQEYTAPHSLQHLVQQDMPYDCYCHYVLEFILSSAVTSNESIH